MGSHEVFVRSSEESVRDIIELKTPSPLTTSRSSGSSKSLGINEYTRTRIFDETFVRVSSDEEYPRSNESKKKSKRRNKSLSNSVPVSSSSSASSLKRRIRDFRSSGDDCKYSDRLVTLNHRMRRERAVYLQLQGLNERIDEKDETETSSCLDGFARTANLSQEVSSREGVKMCSSAPETMRLPKDECPQGFLGLSDETSSRGSRGCDDVRPPKYLRPIEQLPSREIIRSNAPPLCLTDERISRLLRRGSISARDQESRASPISSLEDPIGLTIKSLSSGSDGDESDQWRMKKSCRSPSTGDDEPSRRSAYNDDAANPSETVKNIKINATQFMNLVRKICHEPNVAQIKDQSQDRSKSGKNDTRGNNGCLKPRDLTRALSDAAIEQQKPARDANQHHLMQKVPGFYARESRSRILDINVVAKRIEKSLKNIGNGEIPGEDSKKTKKKCVNWVSSASESSRTLKQDSARRIADPNYRSFDCLTKYRQEMNDKTARGPFFDLEKLRVCQERVENYSRRLEAFASNSSDEESSERFKYLKRGGSEIPHAGSSSGSSLLSERGMYVETLSMDKKRQGNPKFQTNIKDGCPDNEAKFTIYQDEYSPERLFSVDKLKGTCLSPPPGNFRRNSSKDISRRNPLWTDCSSDTSRPIASSFDSQIQDSNDLRSPEAYQKKFANGALSPSLDGDSSEDSADPRRRVCKNLEATSYENRETIRDELSRGQPRNAEKEAEAYSSDESADDKKSRTRPTKTRKSESAVDTLRRGFGRTRERKSSSLSRLKPSPGKDRVGRRSQERFPFTMNDERTCSLEEKPQAGRARISGCEMRDEKPTRSPKLHPSLATNRSVEPLTVKVIENCPETASNRGLQRQRPFVPKIRKFVGKLSRWRRSPKDDDEKSPSLITTRILYENKECHDDGTSVEESLKSTNRDGLWVIGLEDETISKKSLVKRDSMLLPEEKYSNELTRNSALCQQDEDIDPEPGCFCAKICRFLIGGHDYHRYYIQPEN